MRTSPTRRRRSSSFAGDTYLQRGELALAEELYRKGVVRCAKRGFTKVEAIHKAGLAFLSALRGQAQSSLEQLRGALEMAGSAYVPPYFIAHCYALAGKPDEAFSTVEKALERAKRSGMDCDSASMYLLRGHMCESKANSDEAEISFRTSIEIARRQEAKSLELRATTSLARLLTNQGKREEARAMLAEIYNWFTEGFDTADLKDAKALLEELNS